MTTATEVRERGIIFSAPMVRAILSGSKSQTRRVMKPQPPEGCAPIAVDVYAPTRVRRDGLAYPGPDVFGAYTEDGEWGWPCPYGQPGDRLFVRETWMAVDLSFREPARYTVRKDGAGKCHAIIYRADADFHCQWTPSIHMPRWASRITLEITDVRVERVAEISEEDAIAEGVFAWEEAQDAAARRAFAEGKKRVEVLDYFRAGWNFLNASRGCGWDSNCWVWVISFRRVEQGG